MDIISMNCLHCGAAMNGKVCEVPLCKATISVVHSGTEDTIAKLAGLEDVALRQRMTDLEAEYDQIRRILVERNRPKYVDGAAILRELDARESARRKIRNAHEQAPANILEELGFEVVR